MTKENLTGVHLLQAVNAFGHILLEPFFLLNPGPEDPEKMIILYPDDRQPANPAVMKIIQRYFEVIPINAERFNFVMQGQLSLNDQHGNPLLRMPPVDFAIDRWAEKLLRGDLAHPPLSRTIG